MNSAARLIALAMFVAIAMSATQGTFASVTSFASATSGAALYTNGYMVTLTAAGWAYGDPISITTASGTSTTYTTLISNTGVAGVGLLVRTAVAGCTTAPTSASTGYTTASLVGGASNTCPVDFFTLYTGTPTGTSTSRITYAATTAQLIVNTPVLWTITNPSSVAAGQCAGVAVSYTGSTITPSTAGACTGSNVETISTSSFAFYVQATTAAQVCFQTSTQYAAGAGACGSLVTSSAGILSATISGFVAMIALIFFN